MGGGGGGPNSNDQRFWAEFDRLNQMSPTPGAAMPMASGVGVASGYRDPLEDDLLERAGLAHAAASEYGMGLDVRQQPFFTPTPRPPMAPVPVPAWINPDDDDNGPVARVRQQQAMQG